MTDFVLADVKHCPVCGCGDRVNSDGMQPQKTAGYHYLKHAAVRLRLSVEQLVDRVSVYRCDRCGSFYCDPWLSPELASEVFCVGAPDHIAGWGNFEEWLSSPAPNFVERRNRKLYSIIQKRIGNVNAYAEFGCPFQGFLLPFKGAEIAPSERLRSFSHALDKEPDARWSNVTRIYHRGERWLRKLMAGYLRARYWKEQIRRPVVPARLGPVPAQRVFLTEDTSRGWGSNCVRYGASCRYFARQTLSADVIPLAQATAIASFQFDLIGVFNSLDHTTAPVNVIRNCLSIASHVLVVTHHASHAGRQHLYAFADNFPAWLGQQLPNAVTHDLAGEVESGNLPSDCNYILVSRSGQGRH